MEELTPPPVPPECDLTDFAFMPLEVNRLRRSKNWLICKRRPDLAFYMLNLWAASWHSVPAASLEDDDDVLADLAMCEPRRWSKVRADVMRGWAKHSDGKLYHPVVAEKAREAWEAKLAQRDRTEAARKARDAKRQGQPARPTEAATDIATNSVTENATENVTDDATTSVTESKGQGQGQGQGDSRTPHSPPEGGDRAPRRFRKGGGGEPATTPDDRERNQWAWRLKGWKKRRFWVDLWGPKPGEAGCRVPPDLLEDDAA